MIKRLLNLRPGPAHTLTHTDTQNRRMASSPPQVLYGPAAVMLQASEGGGTRGGVSEIGPQEGEGAGGGKGEDVGRGRGREGRRSVGGAWNGEERVERVL